MKKMTKVMSGIFEFSHMILKDSGFLFFNDELFKKVGDNFVHIPSDIQRKLINTQKFYQGTDATYGSNNKKQYLNDGTITGIEGVIFKVNKGKWEIDYSHQNDIFPLP